MGMTAVVRTGLARVGDLRIAYESVGTGDPALLFIHGVFQDRSYFACQQTHFSGRRHVVTLDLRGHSMSGAVALKVASARPELVRGVALLDAAVLFPEPVRQTGLANLVPALATERWMDALRGYFSNRILDPQDPPELTGRVMTDLGRARPEFAYTFFTSLFVSDCADDIKNAECPLLYIHAKAPTDLQRLVELRPDATVGQVVGSGHYLMRSVPDQVNAMLDRFLEVVDAASHS